MQLRAKIPPVYHPFFPDILDLEIPEEKIATCSNCTLCQSAQSPYINTKCCAYYPHLANYLVGGTLADPHPGLAEGRNRIRRLIAERRGITPYGIIPPVRYTHIKKEHDHLDFWERPKTFNEQMLCPFYDNGNCSVWKYRENLCVTFFCSSIGGRQGNLFWEKVNEYMKMAERELARYALLQLGWPARDIIVDEVKNSNVRIDDEEGGLNEERYQYYWQDWHGREEAFYVRCYEVINEVSPQTFQRLSGLTQEILAAGIRETNESFHHAVLPERMMLNPETQFEKKNDKHYTLRLGDAAIDIPAIYLPLVKAFNGRRTTQEVCHLGYKVFIKLVNLADDLYRKNFLIAADAKHLSQ